MASRLELAGGFVGKFLDDESGTGAHRIGVEHQDDISATFRDDKTETSACLPPTTMPRSGEVSRRGRAPTAARPASSRRERSRSARRRTG